MRWVADAVQTTTDQYVAELTSAGLRVGRVTVHERAAGETYWASMLSVVNDAIILGAPAEHLSLGADVRRLIEAERRAVDTWLDYTTFTAAKPK